MKTKISKKELLEHLEYLRKRKFENGNGMDNYYFDLKEKRIILLTEITGWVEQQKEKISKKEFIKYLLVLEKGKKEKGMG